MAILEIKQYSKSYGGGKKAVDALSLEVRSGEIYGFIGHNGAGKSTTIRAAVGVLDFDEGEILIDGHSLKTDRLEAKKKLAYVPDDPELYDFLTGMQYLNFVADVFRMSAADREEKIRRFADAFEIREALGDLIGSYSHGMKQKVALIAALIHDPKLLVLDEPFVGLDPKAALTLKHQMRELCDRGGAVFFSTHVLEVAEKLCDRIGIIKKGKMVAEGETASLIGDQSLEEVFMEVTEHA